MFNSVSGTRQAFTEQIKSDIMLSLSPFQILLYLLHFIFIFIFFLKSSSFLITFSFS